MTSRRLLILALALLPLNCSPAFGEQPFEVKRATVTQKPQRWIWKAEVATRQFYTDGTQSEWTVTRTMMAEEGSPTTRPAK